MDPCHLGCRQPRPFLQSRINKTYSPPHRGQDLETQQRQNNQIVASLAGLLVYTLMIQCR